MFFRRSPRRRGNSATGSFFERTLSRWNRSNTERVFGLKRGYARRLSIEPLEDRQLLAVFTVDTIVDENDGIGTGGVSLRDAVAAANTNGAAVADTIQFAAALDGQTILLNVANGDIDITQGNLTIEGDTNLTLGIVISANDPSPTAGDGIRIFNIDDGTGANVAVNLDDLTLIGGDTSGGGGAILSRENLSITDSTVSGNRAALRGGGIYSPDGTLTVTSSTISSNISTGDDGGGIAATGDGLAITDSTISGNTSGTGAGDHGGGIYAFPIPLVTITRSTISGNTSFDDGGGLYFDNTTTGTIISSTISGNFAADDGGGLWADVDAGETLTIRHSTFTGNTSNSDNTGGGSGGGIYLSNGTGAVTIEHTIVAGNFDNSATGAEDIDNTSATGNPTITNKFNFIGVNTGHAIANGANGSQVGTAASPLNPQLGPLANNGGPTLTHLPILGSPVIDKGEPVPVPPAPGTDQRGFVRVVNGDFVAGAIIDIGSVEFVIPPATVQADIVAGDAFIRDITANGSDNNIIIRFEEDAEGGTNFVVTGTDIIIAGAGFVQEAPNKVRTARANITNQRVLVNLLAGDDTLTVDSVGGVLDFANGIRYDAGDDFDRLRTVQSAGGPALASGTYLVGANPGDGRTELVDTAGRLQFIEFRNVNPTFFAPAVPVPTFTISSIPGLASLLQADNAINYTIGPNSNTVNATNPLGLDTGLVTVDNFEPFEFANIQQLIIDAGSGSDLINLNRPTAVDDISPTALTEIRVEAGDPTAGSDTVVVNDIDNTTPIVVDTLGADSATVTGAQVAAVNVNDTERLIINGQGGNDNLTITTPTGNHLIFLNDDNSLADAGSVLIRQSAGLGGADLLPISFLNLGTSGSLTLADAAAPAVRADFLAITPRLNGSSDVFTVSSTGVVDLTEIAVGAPNRQMVTINTPGVNELTLYGLDGDDTFNIATNHPFTTGLFIDGGDPSASDVLNLNGAAATAETVTISPNAANPTMQTIAGLGGPTTVSGVEVIKYTGVVTAGTADDKLNVNLGTGVATARVQGAATATDEVVSNRLPTIQFTVIADFDLQGSTQPTTATFVPDNLSGASGGADTLNAYRFVSNTANDTLVVEGDGGGVTADNVTVSLNAGNLRIAANTKTIETTGMTATDLLNVVSLGGNDSLTVDVATGTLIPSTMFYDGGTGADALTVQGAFDGGAGDTTSVTYTPGLQADEGRLVYTETAPEARTMDITFDNMEPVTDTTTADTLTINGNGAANAITVIKDPVTADATARGLVTIDGFETMSFNNKTELVVNGLGGDDIVNVNIVAAAVIAGLTTLRINANDGNDTVRLHSLPVAAGFTNARVDGGSGNDTIDASNIPTSTAKPLTLNGDEGNDTITGAAGVDTISGGANDDTLVDSPGADVYSGNGGNDTLVLRGTFLNDLISAVQLAPSAVVGANYELSVINGPLATPPAAVVDQITTTNAGLSPSNAANLPTVERILIEALAGDDVIAVSHADAYSDLNGANGVAAQTITVQVIGDSPNASDRLIVQDAGSGDLVIHREGPDSRSGSIVVGGMAPVSYETTERVDITPLDILGRTGIADIGVPAVPAGRLVTFKHDDFEHNDSETDATLLGLDPVVIGERNIDPGGINVPPFGTIPGDQDWYEFQPTKKSTYRFDIFFEHIGTLANGRPGLPGDGNLRLEVYRANGVLIAASDISTTTPINVDTKESITIGLDPDVTQSAFVRVVGSTAAAINMYDITVTDVDTEGPRVFDPAGPTVAIFPNNQTSFDLFDPKPTALAAGATPPIFSLTINIEDLPNPRFPGDPYPALNTQSASQPGIYQVVGDHVGIIPIESVDVLHNYQFTGTVTTAINTSMFTAAGLVGSAQQPVVGDFIAFTSGPASGEVRTITAYNAATGQITVNVPFTNAPTAGSTFNITSFPEAQIVLNFREALPDDRFTLRILDSIIDPPGNRLDGESDASEPQAPTFPSGNGVPGGDFIARFTVDTRPEIGSAVAADIDIDINGNYFWDPANSQIGNDHTNVDLSFTMTVQNGANGPLTTGGLNVNDLVFAGRFTNNGAGLPNRLFDQLGVYGYAADIATPGQRWLIDLNGDGMITTGIDIFTAQPSLGATFNVAGAIPIAGNFASGFAGDEVGLFNAGKWGLDTNHDYIIQAGEVFTGSIVGIPFVGDFDGDGLDDLAVFNNNTFYFDFKANGFGGNDANISYWGFPGVLDRPIAADIDQDGIDDVGLWVPRNSASLPQGVSEWYFLVSDTAMAPITRNPTLTLPATTASSFFAANLIGTNSASIVGKLLRVRSGANVDQVRTVSAFNTATGQITLSSPLASAPAVGDIIAIGGTANTLETVNHAFSPAPFGFDISAEFGDELAMPLIGNFDPPVAPTPVAPNTGIVGDYDNSGDVSTGDYNAWKASFGTSRNIANGNGDGKSDAADYVVWRKFFGSGAPGSPASGSSGSNQVQAAEEVGFGAAFSFSAIISEDANDLVTSPASAMASETATSAPDYRAVSVDRFFDSGSTPSGSRSATVAPRVAFAADENDELLLSAVAEMAAQLRDAMSDEFAKFELFDEGDESAADDLVDDFAALDAAFQTL